MTDFNLSLGRKGKYGEFDSSDVKEGTKKADLQSEVSRNIFDAFDNDNDGTLNEIEIEKLLAQLKDAAKNDKLSKREAKKLLKLEGLKGVKAEHLFNFLKEITAAGVEDDYSAYDDGSMGLEIKGSQNAADEEDIITEEDFEAAADKEEDLIDNSKAYLENGRVIKFGDDGKSILVQENENSEPVKLQIDDDGNIISYAKNGESFKMTAKRLGLPTEGERFDQFVALNEKAAAKGYFLVGGKVKIPAEAVDTLALDKVNVNSDAEIAAYNKLISKQKEEAAADEVESQAGETSSELTDEEFRKKYPYIARPEEGKPAYEPPKWEAPPQFEPGPVPVDEKPATPAPSAPAETMETPEHQAPVSSDKTPGGNPKQLSVTKDDFTLESIRKRYPAEKYEECKTGENSVAFKNKTTGETVFGIRGCGTEKVVATIFKDGNPKTVMAIYNNENRFQRQQYDDNGVLKSLASYDGTTGKIYLEEEFSDGRKVKFIKYNDNGLKTEETIYRSENQDDIEIKKYQSDGTLISSYDGLTKKTTCPLAEELKEYIYAKNAMGLPVSKDKEIKETVLNKLNEENTSIIMEAYREATGVDLFKDISDEWAISSSDMKEIRNHLETCLAKKYGYDPHYKNNRSQVINEHHKGEPYQVTQKDDIIRIKNINTKEVCTVNLEKLFKNVPLDKKIHLKAIVQKLPGEVLADMSVEAGIIDYAPTDEDGVSGFYLEGSDSITTDTSAETLVHELGHAVDYNGWIINTSSIEASEDFKKIFEEEMKNFTDAGNKPWDGDNTAQADVGYHYCTKNMREMFAECYTYLMTGDNQSKGVIEKYFPKCLAFIDNHIAQVREENSFKRRSILS